MDAGEGRWVPGEASTSVLPVGLPGHIRAIEPIGRGGSAVVWRARDRRAGRDVAVRVIGVGSGRSSADASDGSGGADGAVMPPPTERFEHELRALARLAAHPHVIDLLAAGIDDDVAWVVTPLAETSLRDELAGSGPIAASEITSLCVALASALDVAHALEVVHGDVTPANVLFVDGRAVLADFGSSVLRTPAQATAPRMSRGGAPERFGATPGWAAPERLDGSAPTSASDVYGLGATVWSAATGVRPPLHRPPDRTAVPRGLDAIVAACCEVDPRRRPLAAEVQQWADSERRRRHRYCPGP